MVIYIMLCNFLRFIFLYSSGLLLSFVFVSYFHYKDFKLSRLEELRELTEENQFFQFIDLYKEKIILLKNVKENKQTHVSSDEDECNETQDELYDTRIIKKVKPVNEDEFTIFFTNEYVKMTTPLHGDIIMNYDNENNIFNYYCNRKDIPYSVLDVVCRKYVLTYDILDKYHINFTHNYQNMEEDEQDDILSRTSETQQEELTDEEFKKLSDDEIEKENENHETKINPFHKIQQKSEENNKIKTVYEKKINNFKYKGNLIDYECVIDKKVSNVNSNINYSDYKQQLYSQKNE